MSSRSPTCRRVALFFHTLALQWLHPELIGWELMLNHCAHSVRVGADRRGIGNIRNVRWPFSTDVALQLGKLKRCYQEGWCLTPVFQVPNLLTYCYNFATSRLIRIWPMDGENSEGKQVIFRGEIMCDTISWATASVLKRAFFCLCMRLLPHAGYIVGSRYAQFIVPLLLQSGIQATIKVLYFIQKQMCLSN